MEKETPKEEKKYVVAYNQGSSLEIVTLEEAIDRRMFILEEVDDGYQQTNNNQN